MKFPAQGLEAFENEAAKAINLARLSHLETLGIPLAGKRLLDVGCGVGHLAAFLENKGGRVVCVDARHENVAALKAKYPHLEAHHLDIETGSLTELGRFQIVFCYGLLYHLENPMAAIRRMSEACDETILIETIVTDHREALTRIVAESASSNEALRGIGSRPTPSYVAIALASSGFGHVYVPRTPPGHPDFRFQPKNDLACARDGHNLRAVFVASRTELRNPRLLAIAP